MTYEVKHHINGEEVSSAGTERQNILNPATGETIGTLHLGGDPELQAAVAAAKTASASWSELSLARRTAILFKCWLLTLTNLLNWLYASTVRCFPTPRVKSPAARKS